MNNFYLVVYYVNGIRNSAEFDHESHALSTMDDVKITYPDAVIKLFYTDDGLNFARVR